MKRKEKVLFRLILMRFFIMAALGREVVEGNLLTINLMIDAGIN